jgi:hypothetical protein
MRQVAQTTPVGGSAACGGCLGDPGRGRAGETLGSREALCGVLGASGVQWARRAFCAAQERLTVVLAVARAGCGDAWRMWASILHRHGSSLADCGLHTTALIHRHDKANTHCRIHDRLLFLNFKCEIKILPSPAPLGTSLRSLQTKIVTKLRTSISDLSKALTGNWGTCLSHAPGTLAGRLLKPFTLKGDPLGHIPAISRRGIQGTLIMRRFSLSESRQPKL